MNLDSLIKFCSYYLIQIRSCRTGIIQELESQLQEQAPHNAADVAHLHELPPLVIDGIPTPIDKMTQVRTFSLVIVLFVLA